jgi:hypothetical protein
VTVGAEVHLRPGQEAAERGRGMGQVTSAHSLPSEFSVVAAT